jgi:hypothetical protein
MTEEEIVAITREVAPPPNPPAFPGSSWGVAEKTVVFMPGMSMRDFFAAAALAGICCSTGRVATAEMDAEQAYKRADAMLRERVKGGRS